MSDEEVRKIPRAPSGLDGAAKRLWREVVTQYVLRVDELRLLEEACKTLTLVAGIEEALEDAPLVVRGAQGQPAANPLLAEIRQHRTLLASLFRQLKLPDEGGGQPGEVSRSVIARNAARSRWAVAHGAPLPEPKPKRLVSTG